MHRVPFNYTELRRASRRRDDESGAHRFPAFEDDGGDLACVLSDLRHLWEQGHLNAAVAALAILALLDERGAR